MTTVATNEIHTRAIPEFDRVGEVWPRGARLDAVREATLRFKVRFAGQGAVHAVRAIDLAAAAYPVKYAFHGAARGINPYVSIINRLLVVEYEDFDGNRKVLVWEPTAPEGTKEAPFYAQLIDRYGEKLSNNVFATYWNSVEQALALCGLRPADVDVAAFDHLHVQDPRMILGTSQPVDGTIWEPMLPNATFICQRVEVDTFRSPHPMQWAWYVADGWKDIREDKVQYIDGDVELGPGLAIIATPGHTDGNQSIAINTPSGVWVSSENGVSIDNWQPEHSRIPGVKSTAAFFRREVIMNANTLEDSVEQYDSMVKEKTLADRCKADPRFVQVLPSSELAPWRRQWPVVPTHHHGADAIGFGTFSHSRSAS